MTQNLDEICLYRQSCHAGPVDLPQIKPVHFIDLNPCRPPTVSEHNSQMAPVVGNRGTGGEDMKYFSHPAAICGTLVDVLCPRCD